MAEPEMGEMDEAELEAMMAEIHGDRFGGASYQGDELVADHSLFRDFDTLHTMQSESEFLGGDGSPASPFTSKAALAAAVAKGEDLYGAGPGPSLAPHGMSSAELQQHASGSGSPLSTSTHKLVPRLCPSCKIHITGVHVFCTFCGKPLGGSTTTPARANSVAPFQRPQTPSSTRPQVLNKPVKPPVKPPVLPRPPPISNNSSPRRPPPGCKPPPRIKHQLPKNTPSPRMSATPSHGAAAAMNHSRSPNAPKLPTSPYSSRKSAFTFEQQQGSSSIPPPPPLPSDAPHTKRTVRLPSVEEDGAVESNSSLPPAPPHMRSSSSSDAEGKSSGRRGSSPGSGGGFIRRRLSSLSRTLSNVNLPSPRSKPIRKHSAPYLDSSPPQLQPLSLAADDKPPPQRRRSSGGASISAFQTVRNLVRTATLKGIAPPQRPPMPAAAAEARSTHASAMKVGPPPRTRKHSGSINLPVESSAAATVRELLTTVDHAPASVAGTPVDRGLATLPRRSKPPYPSTQRFRESSRATTHRRSPSASSIYPVNTSSTFGGSPTKADAAAAGISPYLTSSYAPSSYHNRSLTTLRLNTTPPDSPFLDPANNHWSSSRRITAHNPNIPGNEHLKNTSSHQPSGGGPTMKPHPHALSLKTLPSALTRSTPSLTLPKISLQKSKKSLQIQVSPPYNARAPPTSPSNTAMRFVPSAAASASGGGATGHGHVDDDELKVGGGGLGGVGSRSSPTAMGRVKKVAVDPDNLFVPDVQERDFSKILTQGANFLIYQRAPPPSPLHAANSTSSANSSTSSTPRAASTPRHGGGGGGGAAAAPKLERGSTASRLLAKPAQKFSRASNVASKLLPKHERHRSGSAGSSKSRPTSPIPALVEDPLATDERDGFPSRVATRMASDADVDASDAQNLQMMNDRRRFVEVQCATDLSRITIDGNEYKTADIKDVIRGRHTPMFQNFDSEERDLHARLGFPPATEEVIVSTRNRSFSIVFVSTTALGGKTSNTVDLEASTTYLRDSWVASLQWLKSLMKRVETSGGPYNFKHVTHVDRSYHWTGENLEEILELTKKISKVSFADVIHSADGRYQLRSVSPFDARKPAFSWGESDVHAWLRAVKFGDYVKNFADARINGRQLVQMTDEVLASRVMIGRRAHRKRMLAEIDKLR